VRKTFKRKICLSVLFVMVLGILYANNFHNYQQLSVVEIQNQDYVILDEGNDYIIVVIDGITYYVEK